jgi:hypothetical protein
MFSVRNNIVFSKNVIYNDFTEKEFPAEGKKIISRKYRYISADLSLLVLIYNLFYIEYNGCIKLLL